jgi:DNA-binding beta-propeller fold protein YncE
LYQFAFRADGALVPIDKPVSNGRNLLPYAMAIRSQGRGQGGFAYVANFATGTNATRFGLSEYALSSTGALTLMGYVRGGEQEVAVAVDNVHNYVYTVNQSDNTFSVYATDDRGGVTLEGFVSTMGIRPSDIAIACTES